LTADGTGLPAGTHGWVTLVWYAGLPRRDGTVASRHLLVGSFLPTYVVKQINVLVDDGTHERLAEWKSERDMTWADVLFHGVDVDE